MVKNTTPKQINYAENPIFTTPSAGNDDGEGHS